MTRPLRLLLSGYYGFDNAGDEAVLAAIVQRLRAGYPDAQIAVLSSDPEATADLHGVAAVQRWSIPAVWSALGQSDVLLQGGGSLIQDATSRVSPVYYLGLLRMARLRRVPSVVLAQGLGPLRTPALRSWLRREFASCAAITVRDDESLADLARLGVTSPAPVRVADPALLLEPPASGSAGLELAPRVVLALRLWPGVEGVVQSCQDLARWLWESRGLVIDVVPFQPAQDMPVAQEISQAALGCRLVTGVRHPAEFVALVDRARLVVSMRLHGLIFAAARQVPAVGLSYDPKLDAFAAMAGQPVLSLAECTSQGLIAACEQALDSASDLAPQRRQAAESLHTQAELTFATLHQTLTRLNLT